MLLRYQLLREHEGGARNLGEIAIKLRLVKQLLNESWALQHSSSGSHATEMDFFIMSCENKKKFKVHSFTVCSLLRLISSPFMTSFLLICLSYSRPWNQNLYGQGKKHPAWLQVSRMPCESGSQGIVWLQCYTFSLVLLDPNQSQDLSRLGGHNVAESYVTYSEWLRLNYLLYLRVWPWEGRAEV